jgi:hypothetical protein
MAREQGSAIKVVLNVWAIIGIIATVSGAITGGVFWLNDTFAKVTKLEEEKTTLSQNLDAVKVELLAVERKLKIEQCRLHYSVQEQSAKASLDDLVGQADRLKDKFPNERDTSPSAEAERVRLRTRIDDKDQEICAQSERWSCLHALKESCPENSVIDVDGCTEAGFRHGVCRD